MQNKARKNYIIYVLMLLLFGGLIYVAIEEGDRFSHHAANTLNTVQDGPFAMFLQFMQDNLHHPLTTLLIQIIAVLLMVRLFGYLFSLIGQPGVIGEIVADTRLPEPRIRVRRSNRGNTDNHRKESGSRLFPVEHLLQRR